MVLTPQARAIAAFALAVTVILGSWSRGSYALVLVLLQNDARIAAIIGSLVPFAVGALAYLLAQSALRGSLPTGDTAGWAAHVAGAARLLAAAAIVLTLLVLLGSLVRGDNVYNTMF